MNNVKIIHVSDVHANKDRIPVVRQVFDKLKITILQEEVDAVVFSGDFWDSTITNTRASGFIDCVEMVYQLQKLCDIIFVMGTPRHEPEGSLEIFKSVGCFVFDKTERRLLTLRNGKRLDILAIPEPRRGSYLGTSAEIDEQIKADFSKLSVHKKEEYPFLVVYHGEVAGALYQNGMEPQSTTAISKTFLKGFNADYIALGHIHMPQKILDNAYYAGSAAPKDFGEDHNGIFFVANLSDKSVKIVPTDTPRYFTFNLGYWQKLKKTKFTGHHVRLLVPYGQDVRELQEKLDYGLLTCKKVIDKLEKQEERRSDVCKKQTAVEKLEEYSRTNNLKIPSTAKDILQGMEDKLLTKFSFPSKSFELLSVSIRGSIGIKCGFNKDEVKIDFSDFGNGIVALVGANGKGKTTIIENCHPYPRMLTRPGALKDHFYLKDSHRILIYKDEDGLYYKISMLITAHVKTGSVQYFVHTSKDGINWRAVTGVDGSLDAYNQYILGTFGSLELFLRTCFIAKESIKGLSDLTVATKGEKIDLFSKLAGTDYMKEILVMIRDEKAICERNLAELTYLDSEIERTEDQIECIKLETKEREERTKGIREKLEELAPIEAEILDYETRRNELIAESRAAQQSYDSLFASKLVIEGNLRTLENNQKLFEKRASVEKELESISPLKKDVEKLTEVVSVLKDELSDLNDELDDVADEIYDVKEEISTVKIAKASIENSIANAESSSFTDKEICPVCGQKLPEDAKARLLHEQELKQKEIKTFQAQLSKAEKRLADNEKSFEKLKEKQARVRREVQSVKKKLEKNETSLNSKKELLDTNIKTVETKTGYDYRELSMVRSGDCLKEIKETQERIKALTEDMEKIKTIEVPESKEAELKDVRDRRIDLISSLSATEAEIKRLEFDLLSKKDRLKELGELKSNKDSLVERSFVLKFLETAFCATGIPLLELEGILPEIQDIANKILEDAYGPRFQLSFSTTRKSKDRQIDDLDIQIYDNDHNMMKTLDLICSGEKVWIKQALFFAFSIARKNKTGFNFKTRFIDELDGSLDSLARGRYLSMIESSHQYSGSTLTVLITHSQEIKDVVDSKIEL